MTEPRSGTCYERAVAALKAAGHLPSAIALEYELVWLHLPSELLASASEPQAVFEAQHLMPPEAVEVCAALHGAGSRIALIGVMPGTPEDMAKLVAGGPLSAYITHQHMLCAEDLQGSTTSSEANQQQEQQHRQKGVEEHWAKLRLKTGVPASDTLALCSCSASIRAANRSGMRAAVQERGARGLTVDTLKTGLTLFCEKASDDRGF